MLLGVFGDIHGNQQALEAVLAEFRRLNCEKLVCLGDVVGYGGAPKQCIEIMVNEEIACVKGNHDFYVADTDKERFWEIHEEGRIAIEWTQRQLNSHHLDWLRSLPFLLEFDDSTFIHASTETAKGEYWPYVMDKNMAQFHFYLQKSQISFCGHAHIPLMFTHDGKDICMELLKKSKLDLNSTFKYLINPGAVGQPRDSNWKAAAAIFDSSSGDIHPIRVSYDLSRAQQDIIDADLPLDLAERLGGGR